MIPLPAKPDDALATLRQTLYSTSDVLAGLMHFRLIEAADYAASDGSIEDLVGFLNSTCDAIISDEPGNSESQSQPLAVEILAQIHQYVASPALKQEVVDDLAFWVPKVVGRFACVSTRCLEVADDVVDLFIGKCSPRDMLSSLCDAMASPVEPFMVPGYFMPLLSGLTKVIILIQRQKYKHVKTAVSVILEVLMACSNSDDEDIVCEKLLHRATGVAYSIRKIISNLEGEDKKNFRALLGLYILQIMAFVSVGITSDISRCLAMVLELSDFFQHCELSYIGLITGCEVDTISNLFRGDDSEVDSNCFSQVKLGAALAVIWGYKASDVALAANADFTALLKELQGNLTRRWEAVGMLKYIFSCAKLSWELKHDGIKFLLCIMDGIVTQSDNDSVDYSIHLTTIYSSLQAIEMVIMYAPDSVLRKNAFSVFRKLLADIPTSGRFDVLMALIKNNDSSSMIGILIDFVKEEMHSEKVKRNSSANAGLNSDVSRSISFWQPSVLEVVEMILRPPNGGPPSLPEYSDAILSALNLYRFILITESTGKSNYTGILSKDNLHKSYNEWLLPLRTLVNRSVSGIQDDLDQSLSDAVMCALNPLELVLYRCIELVEEKVRQHL